MTKDGLRLLTLCAGPCGIYTHTECHTKCLCVTQKKEKKKKDPEELLESVRVVCLRRKKKKLTPMSALEKETEEERNFAGLNSIIFFLSFP